jgi:hypothetical protein
MFLVKLILLLNLNSNINKFVNFISSYKIDLKVLSKHSPYTEIVISNSFKFEITLKKNIKKRFMTFFMILVEYYMKYLL